MIDYQDKLIERIKLIAGNHKNAVDRLSEVLNIAKPTAYKKLNGESSFSITELALIMRDFNLSFDELVFDKRKKIGFQFPFKTRKIKTFHDYVIPLKMFMAIAAPIPHLKIHYATNELPFFFYFLDKDLTYFKFYIYALTVWDLPGFKNKKFNLEDFSEWYVIKDDIDFIINKYYSIPNIELWNEGVLNNTLNQIKYFLTAGFFQKPQDALYLCDRLVNMINHVYKMAETGKKITFGQNPDLIDTEFLMYHNEISHTNNILLIQSEPLNQIYFAYDNPNYIVTDNQDLIDYTEKWFEKIKKNALPISLDSEKNRRAFFNIILKQIDNTKNDIEHIIEKYYS